MMSSILTMLKFSAAAKQYRDARRVVLGWSRRRQLEPAITARMRIAAAPLMAEDAG